MAGPRALGRRLPVRKIEIRSRGGPVLVRFFTWDPAIRTFVPWGTPTDFVATVGFPGQDDQPLVAGGKPGSQTKGAFFPRSSRDNGPRLSDILPHDEHRFITGLTQAVQDGIEEDPGLEEVPTSSPTPAVSRYQLDLRDYSPTSLTPPPADEASRTALDNYGMLDTLPEIGGSFSRPRGWRLWYTGHKLDDATSNPDPDAGNLGITDEGPWIGHWWRFGEHSGQGVPRPHELYLGVQIPEFSDPWFLYPEGQTHHGIPSGYWDVAGSIGYRYHGHSDPDQSLEWAWGLGTYFQWTNDADAGGQSNPWGESIGPHHLIPFVEVISFWDDYTPTEHGRWELNWILDYHGNSRIGFGYTF